MGKKRNKKSQAENEHKEPLKPFIITKAEIKDDYCHYTKFIQTGVNEGEEQASKNRKAIIHPDMLQAFENLRVHLAIIDDAFHLSAIDLNNCNAAHDHQLARLYDVIGFEIKGEEEAETVILRGTKHIELGDRIGLQTPKIFIGSGANYKWYNELKEAIELCRQEVELYKDGKRSPRPEQMEVEFHETEEIDLQAGKA